MKRLTISVKGNVDVHDSLLYARVNGQIEWNGINTLLAKTHPNYVARVRHEPCAHWRCTGIEDREIPQELIDHQLDLGAYTLDTQFRSKLFLQPADVVVLSINSDVMNRLSFHKRDHYTFFGADPDHWSAANQRWLRDAFDWLPASTPGQSMQLLARIVATIRASGNPSILVFNMSSVVPGEQIVSHRGLEDAFSTRIRAFNLALAQAAPTLDVTVVDVDHVVASAGADRLKLDMLHYTGEGYALIAAEVLRQLEQLGHFDS
jgi:hypothetical protein